MNLEKKRFLFFLSLTVGVSALAFLIIRLAQGYKPDLDNGGLKPTGLLVATSEPDAAQLFVDGKLKSATNTTINLTPGQYEVEIKKDGFFPWKKTLTLKKELVSKTDAFLFSAYPDLKVLTFTGANNPLLSPDGGKVAFSVATASAGKKGVWVLDLTDRALGFNREPRQILKNSITGGGRNFSQAEYEWSPDSKQLLVILGKEVFLVEANRLTETKDLVNISRSLRLTKVNWEEEKKLKYEAKVSKLPKKLLEILEDAVEDIQFSPDENKILYTATASASIPSKIITPSLPGASDQTESRTIEAGGLYVYDLKEDRNFLIPINLDAKASWFPTSRHIFVVEEDKISLVEYDASKPSPPSSCLSPCR